MRRKNTGLNQLILLAVMCLGGWLALGSGMRFLAGFILTVSSASVLFFLKQRAISRPLTQRQAEAWRRMGEGGRSKYVRKAVIVGLLLGLVSSSLVLFNSIKEKGLSTDALEIFAATVLIVIFAFYYAAVKMWDLNEKRRKKP